MYLHRCLEIIGLDRKELRAWAMYDWANSAFNTSVIAAILPIYYYKVSAVTIDEHLRTAYWGYTQTVSLVLIASLAPFLGAIADYAGKKKAFLVNFVVLGAIGTATLSLVGEGSWYLTSVIFILASVGFGGAEVFYESLLPHIAGRHEVDRVSAAGYALGYCGGGLLLSIHLVWMTNPDVFGFQDGNQASRFAFLSVAVWWVLFTLPVLRQVPEPKLRPQENSGASHRTLIIGLERVVQTLRNVRNYPELFTFLLAFCFYSDGINTIIKMATIYGTEIGLEEKTLIGALLLVQILGIPATFAFGLLTKIISPKRCIYLTLVVYTSISILGFFMREPWHFWMLATGVALVQGGSQSLSRSLYTSMIPKDRSSEFFGFYSVFGKFGNILGPLLFGLMSQLTGSSRAGILSLVAFFLLGLVLLKKTNIRAGQLRASEVIL